MAVGSIKGFKVKKGNETGIAKIATDAILDKAVTKAKLAQAVQDEVDKVKDKADANGDYDSLTAGGAKQLLSTVYVDDNEPYNFRTAGGSADIGDRMYEEVVGGTVAWNQLCNGSSVTVQNGHKYIAKTGSTWTVGASIGTAISNLTSGSDMVFDLTQMFGSTIADYIYNLELGTAGAGVAWFRKLFPKPYYEYNAGELMSVKAGSHDTVGFNAWDEEWELGLYQSVGKTSSNNFMRCKNLIPVIEGQTYRIERPCRDAYTWGYADKNYSNGASISEKSNGNIEIPTGVHYLGFSVPVSQYGSSTYKNDMCVHLVWDGERNGEYEPYELHEYPLAELELRGIPKLDANNQLYYDGDTYASDGTVTRKYGIVDLGTLSWTYDSGENWRFRADFPSLALGSLNLFCTRYEADTGSHIYWHTKDKTISSHSSVHEMWVYDTAYTNASATEFKTAMSGVYLVYELAEPTTETADTFVNPQVVDDFGTEEYTDYAVEAGDRDVAIPVGHNSQYMSNLRAKLEMAPDSPSGDGKYIVQQSSGENAYIPYTADGRLDAIEAKLPAPPSANGTYKLTATVTDGGVTYTWVAG